MSNAPSSVSRQGVWQRRLGMIAAVLFTALLVSSLLFVLNRAHQSSLGTPGLPIGGLHSLLSLHMMNASTGWSLSDHSALRTTDGGNHWKNVTPPNITLTPDSVADFRTASIVWIAMPQASGTIKVLHTADGGQTWQQTTMQAVFPRQISFIDSLHGWLLAASRPPGGAAESVSVFRTTDGGKTWVNTATALFADATPPGHLPYGGLKSGIYFLNASTGWVTGTVSVPNLAWLYATHDGGSTWNQETFSMPSGVPSARISIISPTFFSATDGILPVIFTDFSTDKGIATDIYVTHDGGRSWQSTAPIFVALNVHDFVDMQHGWATNGTLLYRTIDGGVHWTELSPSKSFKNISQLDFVSGEEGWAISSTASNSSSLLKTEDGGITWSVISSRIS